MQIQSIANKIEAARQLRAAGFEFSTTVRGEHRDWCTICGQEVLEGHPCEVC